ncbi:efflux RND transporter periplasmic adaptor subunit [Hufsiella ginkgonis]|uniref:Efflux RND transporter periplasmic adaptor subunit n=1 Tax=Hufsiella ginkgonis TaxID=2695274 RepID=A0A7K1XST2_9SPHI|nr:efflux RND transporter periplasmic adaptor subunit [Hufsiella ginkgonis]MXV13937.1 efflux RND transporter periplasmic adaptor subunit [Hufsiella ginkgonis]
MKTKYIVYAILILLVGSLVAYRITKNKAEKAQAGAGRGGAGGGKGGPGGAGAPPMRVEGIVVTPREFSNSLSVSGSVQANEQVQIRSEVPGLVRAIGFSEGSSVSKGQVLLRIDDSELRAQLAQALTKEKLSAENENRAKQLLEKEAISREEYETSLADLRSLQAQTQLIRAQLAKTLVRAPFSGKIGLRSISVGEYLTPTTAVANLVNTDPVKIQFSVPEKYAGQLDVNSSISFSIAGLPGKYSARIFAIEPGIDAGSRTLQLKARAANPSGKLLPGSFAKIDLPLATIKDAILIPTQAVVPVMNGKKVYITEDGKAKEVMIETSARTEKDVLVTSGLKAGDTVLTTGIMAMKPETAVKVKTGSGKGDKGKEGESKKPKAKS